MSIVTEKINVKFYHVFSYYFTYHRRGYPPTRPLYGSHRGYDAPMLKKEKVELPSCNIIQMGGRTPPITNRSGFLVAAAPPPSEIGARKL